MFVLSGLVSDGGRPVDNARVDVLAIQRIAETRRELWRAGSAMTEGSGRYRILVLSLPDRSGVSDEAPTVWTSASKEGYVQQCAAPAITTKADAVLDLTLTRITDLSTSRPISRTDSRTVSGVVFEATPTGRQPAESAPVFWEDFYDGWFNAETRTDAAGRYLLCGLPRRRISVLWAFKPGYTSDSVSVEAGSDAVVDIEIRRR
jgi:hypothetical protein